MIVVIYAHPYPSRSRAGRALVDAVRTLPDVEVRSLYDLYPDFDIDVAGEQQALARAELIVWLHPIYWYSVPGLLKHWFDKVLERGWAYGIGGTALSGKHCLWAPTVGGAAATYAPGQSNLKPFSNYIDPVVESALKAGRHALEALGLDAYRAREIADTFRRHNLSVLEATMLVFHDENKYLTAAKAGREELERMFSHDRMKFEEEHGDEEWR